MGFDTLIDLRATKGLCHTFSPKMPQGKVTLPHAATAGPSTDSYSTPVLISCSKPSLLAPLTLTSCLRSWERFFFKSMHFQVVE